MRLKTNMSGLMAAIIEVPQYVSHLNPIVLEVDTNPRQIMESIDQAQINPAYEGDLNYDQTTQVLDEYKMGLSLHYLSQAHNLQNLYKGQIISTLEKYILDFSSQNTENATLLNRLVSENHFVLDRNLKPLIEKVHYISKNIFGKYFYNLKKETSGISPGMFFTGIGMLFSGYFINSRAELIEDENVASGQQVTAITQMSIGAALTITPFIKAGIKTAIK